MFLPGMWLLVLSFCRKLMMCVFCQILKPAEKKAKYPYSGMNAGRPVTPPRKPKKKDSKI